MSLASAAGRAESIAARVVKEAQAYLDSGAPVGEHLADQLLLPLALGAAARDRRPARLPARRLGRTLARV